MGTPPTTQGSAGMLNIIHNQRIIKTILINRKDGRYRLRGVCARFGGEYCFVRSKDESSVQER